MNELKLWKFILANLNIRHPVILMCVLDSIGSSPGRQGFKMAVTKNKMVGSIGGGIMEHKFVELAKEMIYERDTELYLKKQIHHKQSKINRSGMICSGEQTILLYPIKVYEKKTIAEIISCMEQNKNGTLKITSKGIFFSETSGTQQYHVEIKSTHNFLYTENIGHKNHLYIIGGGHCSLALSRLMRTLDFYVHVFEERADINTLIENEYACEKTVLKNYSELTELVPSGKNNYVTIMTFGYRTDDIALRSLINHEFKYIGVLGSKTKMKQLFNVWRKDNLPENRLKKICSPIGISINSQTPEEIAVSIAAEIIKVKNRSLRSIKNIQAENN